MTLINFLIYALAVWRVSSLLVNESGPGGIFIKIRGLTGITHDEDGKISTIPDTLLAGILSCVWCSSIWIGVFWTVLWIVIPEASLVFAFPFALSAVAVMIEIYARK